LVSHWFLVRDLAHELTHLQNDNSIKPIYPMHPKTANHDNPAKVAGQTLQPFPKMLSWWWF